MHDSCTDSLQVRLAPRFLREEVLLDDDRQIEERMKQAQGFLNSLLEQEDIGKATEANLQSFDQGVVQVLESMLHKATEDKDEANLAKLQQVVEVLQKASGPQPDYEFIEKLISAQGDDALSKVIEENEVKINDELLHRP